MPNVTVIMTVYNGEQYVKLAVDSIVAQTYSDWELIVVDDASTDRTPDILARYRDSRIRTIRCETNRKQAACANLGISFARGKYIARLDSDDVALPDRLAVQVGFMEQHPDVVLVASAAYNIDEQGVRVGFRPGGLSDCDLKFRMVSSNPLVHSSVLYRTATAETLKGYREDEYYWFGEDYEFLSRLACLGKTCVLPQPLIEYRVHPMSISAGNVPGQGRQGESVARANLCRILGQNIDDEAWSAWWRFTMTRPGCSVKFTDLDVGSIASIALMLIERIPHDPGKRCGVPRLWARHALALAARRRNSLTTRARTALMGMSFRVGLATMFFH